MERGKGKADSWTVGRLDGWNSWLVGIVGKEKAESRKRKGESGQSRPPLQLFNYRSTIVPLPFNYRSTIVQRRSDIIKKKYLLYIVGFIAGLVNGLLGSGGGVILVTSLVFLYKLHDHKAHATAISIILPLSVISAFIYIKAGIATMGTTLLVTAGSVIGAYFGSKSLNRLSISFIRKLFGIVMILAAVRMMF